MRSGETGLWRGTLLSLSLGTLLAAAGMSVAMALTTHSSSTSSRTGKSL